MKFTFFKLLACFAGMVFLLAGCSNTENRHRYSRDTDVVLPAENNSNTAACYSSPPEDVFEHILIQADLIFEGEIISDGMTGSNPISATGVLPGNLRLSVDTTSYTIKIQNIWFGEYEGETLTLELVGDSTWGMPKPHKNDQGVFILEERGQTGNYRTVAAGSSIYIKNPPNDRLYSFSSLELFRAFDEKQIETLKAAMQEKLDAVAEEGAATPATGLVGKEYLRLYEEKMGIADSES